MGNRKLVSARLILILAVTLNGSPVLAQSEMDPPLRNWSAPALWHPTAGGRGPAGILGRREVRQADGGGGSHHAPGLRGDQPLPAVRLTQLQLRFRTTRRGQSRSREPPAGSRRTCRPCPPTSRSSTSSARPATASSRSATSRLRRRPGSTTRRPRRSASNAGVVATDGNAIVVQVNQGAGQVDFTVDVNGYYTSSGFVTSLNTLAGDLTLVPGSNISITPGANSLTIDSSVPQGPAGPTGPAGATGATGPRRSGPTGATGAVVPPEPPGPRATGGPQGNQGFPGPQGIPGPIGPDRGHRADGSNRAAGHQGTYSGRTHGAARRPTPRMTRCRSTDRATSVLFLRISNNPPDTSPAFWSLLSQKGDTGATGPTGATGDTGPIGPTGPQGAYGRNRIYGPRGQSARTGPTGATGPQGLTGATGDTGPTGRNRAAGPQGT